MQRVLIVLNILLLLAVGVLFYLYVDYTRNDKHTILQSEKAANTSFKIAYFELDSLENQYEYCKEVRSYIRNKDAQMTKQLNQLRNTYVAKLKEYNQKGPTMSQTEQSEYQQVLMKMQNDYQLREQEMGQEFQNLNMQKLQEIKTNVEDFLKDFCREKGYAYVFATSNEDYLYYKDTLRNITPEIVRLLNEQYKSTKKK
jgi:outer membrane protein